MIKGIALAFVPLLASAADVTGEWTLRVVRFAETSTARVNLKSAGIKVSGTLNELKLEGNLEGDRLTLNATRPGGEEWGKFEGRLTGDDLAGKARQGTTEFDWTAHRTPPVTAAPATHDFEPTVFHRVFSGSIAPALRINPGDSVRTTTVDAGGIDANGTRRSSGGNPETGPFYVNGAIPGDTLAVKLTRLTLNRDSAESGNRIVPTAVQSGYYRDAKFDDKFSGSWKLDRNTQEGTLARPTDRLKNFKVALHPMLGCVGVAPPSSQAFRSGWLGSWGGNMDYNQVREGVTIYLPVYQEGALLFVGDGHALEGDGELNGDALETSMNVEFKVDLIKGSSTQAPRFEDNDYLMASGIAGSLQDALQQATTELARWLERDYKLSSNESNVVLGTSIKYDIAEVVDPQVHIVAKIRKSVLSSLVP